MVYLVLWWLVFFMALPIGVTSQDESTDDTIPGTPGSAPVRPMIWRKAGAASIIAAILWVFFYIFIA
jgi:predicted secreted protein